VLLSLNIIEHSILINSIPGLKHVSNEYSRLYFGCEFCERLIPSLGGLRRVIGEASDRDLRFTLVTPFVTSAGLKALRPLFRHILKKPSHGTEIVVNDWGVFRMLRKEFDLSNIVIGRLLTKQKRDPRVMRYKKNVPVSVLRIFGEPNCDVPILSRFLADEGVTRVELDNIAQGISREGNFLKASVYFPYVYVSAGRLCLVSSREKEKQYRAIGPCKKECLDRAFGLEHPQMDVELFSRGCAQFYKNTVIQKKIGSLNIDRLVFEPEIPL